MRRNLLIAQVLARPPVSATVLLLSGARELGAFAMPARVDCLTLPSLRKNEDGTYVSRRLSLPLDEIVDLRSRMLRTALEQFNPDVFIVDKIPRGIHGELDLALGYLRSSPQTRCVLGLRDILDEPEAVRHEWARDANEQCIGEFFDAVWIYGDPAVYNPLQEYGFSADTAAKASFTGYLNPRLLRALDEEQARILEGIPAGPLALCHVGGGADGYELAAAFAGAELPDGMRGILLTGPFMAPEYRRLLKNRTQGRSDLRILEFVSGLDALIARADRVLSMAGYNTVCENLAFRKQALVVPRIHPRREQLIRASRFDQLGLVEMLHPDRLSSSSLSQWLAHRPPPNGDAGAGFDFAGLDRLPGLIGDLLAGRMSPDSALVCGDRVRTGGIQ